MATSESRGIRAHRGVLRSRAGVVPLDAGAFKWFRLCSARSRPAIPIMRAVLHELIDLLALERLSEDTFRGQSQDLGWGTVFGGQVLGQALSAAQQTVPHERAAHSLHGYFLRPGRVDEAIEYEVDRIRDGRSFTTRRVVARQGARAIFNLAASFQIEEEGASHQASAPEVPGPDGLLSERELALRFAEIIPRRLRERATGERPIEIRPVRPVNPMQPDVREPLKYVWLRAVDRLGDDMALHRYLLAYASDFHFLTTALHPHGLSWMTRGLQLASLDHSMYVHRPFRFDEWLLYAIDSPSSSGARGLVRGQLFDRDGVLVASCVQEGLMRQRDEVPETAG